MPHTRPAASLGRPSNPLTREFTAKSGWARRTRTIRPDCAAPANAHASCAITNDSVARTVKRKCGGGPFLPVVATAPGAGRPRPSSGLVTGGTGSPGFVGTTSPGCKRRVLALLYFFGNRLVIAMNFDIGAPPTAIEKQPERGLQIR